MLHKGAGDPFWGRVPKFLVRVQQIISRALGKFEEENMVLWLYVIIIIINFSIISIIIITHITTLLCN